MTQPTPAENDPTLVLWLTGKLTRFAESGEHPVDAAQHIATALTAAGRLLPAETATYTEWATRLKAHGEYDEELSPSFSGALMTEEERARHRAEHWKRRFGDELVDVMRREVHTTPWTVDQPAAEVKP